MTKRIGIEGAPIFGQPTGVGQYARRLTEAASRGGDGFKLDIIRFWLPFNKFRPPLSPNSRLAYRLIKWFPPAVYFQFFKRLSWAPPYDWFSLRHYDAIIFFNFVAYPVSRKTKSIVVIHDLSYINHKQYVSPKNQRFLEKFVPKSIDLADKIIAVSENTKIELAEHYHVPLDDIAVINPAVDHKIFKPSTETEVKRVLNEFNITKPYILSVATQEPRKNLIGVLNAFEMLPEDLKMKYSLVLTGGKGWLDDTLQTRFDEISKKYSVIRTGYVADEKLPALYSGADLFVYPSFYEGFGIPPLEAMACGVPVITSNNSSLPEVVDNAAIKIVAEDLSALSGQISKVLTDPKLAKGLRQKGLAQAAKFSWDKSAQKLLHILEDLA